MKLVIILLCTFLAFVRAQHLQTAFIYNGTYICALDNGVSLKPIQHHIYEHYADLSKYSECFFKIIQPDVFETINRGVLKDEFSTCIAKYRIIEAVWKAWDFGHGAKPDQFITCIHGVLTNAVANAFEVGRTQSWSAVESEFSKLQTAFEELLKLN